MPAKLTQSQVNAILDSITQEKGVTFTSSFIDTKTPLKFLCTECGTETKITWGQIQQGKNPHFVCVKCSYKYREKSESITYAECANLFESKGSKLIIPEGVEINSKIPTHETLQFICTYCGNLAEVRYGDIKRGRNKNLRCPKCAHIVNDNHLSCESNRVSHEDRKKQTYQHIKETVESKGATLLTTYDEYQDKNSYIRFICSKCKKEEYRIKWRKYEEGQNPNFICQSCLPPKRVITTEFVKSEFASRGVEMVGEYVNSKTPISFKCSQCGELGTITWNNYLTGRNKDLLCPSCAKGNITTEPTTIVYNYSENTPDELKRNKAAQRSSEFARAFYNLPWDIRNQYESHHIKPVKQFPSLIYSLGNIYPLLKSEHHTNNFNYYHKMEEARNPENWPNEARLPYHDYPNFKFFDLNRYLITDFILEEDRTLLKKKKSFAEDGKLYLPLYFSELDLNMYAEIIYSMIRARLAKIPEIGLDIYPYTGQTFTRYNTRKLKIKTVSGMDVLNFFERNHIQGYVECSVCLGLYQDDLLVSAMSFGKPRSDKWRGENNYEMLRFCSRLNSSVPGAASKLFNHFIKNYHPNLVVTFCDVRFSSIDPNDTVYPKLGFEYDGYSAPNYKYAIPGTSLIYSRQQFMKHKLKYRLENYDPNLSEAQNMRNNGYVRLYDCGNFRYVWRKTNA